MKGKAAGIIKKWPRWKQEIIMLWRPERVMKKPLPEVERCPWCRKKAYTYNADGCGMSYIHCANCEARGPERKTIRGAIVAWNLVARKPRAQPKGAKR